MIVTCDHVRAADLVAQYVHRRLSDAERDRFEEHFLGCGACFQAVQDFRLLRESLAPHALPVAAPSAPWWRRLIVPALAAAAATAAVLIAVVVQSPSGPPGLDAPTVAEAPVTAEPQAEPPGAAPAAAIEPPVAAPTGPSRIELVGQLARFEPPAYRPSTLRSVESDGQRRFREAMASYEAGEYAVAAQGLREAARVLPDAAEVHFYLGVSELREGRVAEARAALETVIAGGSPIFEEDARFFLGKAHLVAGDVEEARVSFARVAALAGDREVEARRLVAAIDALPPRS